MTKLECEICGGRLIMGEKDTFECGSCGSCYTKDWVKQKVQTIQGTVKIEGVVDVRVQGGTSVESLIKRAEMLLEEKNFEKASELTEEILKTDPENAHGYILSLLCQFQLSCESELANGRIRIQETRNWARAMEFASGEYKDKLLSLEKQNRTNYEFLLKQAQEKNQKDLEKKKEMEELRKQEIVEIARRHEEIAPAQNRLFPQDDFIIGLCANGNVLVSNLPSAKWVTPASAWTEISQIAVSSNCVVGLHFDGTVVAVAATGRDNGIDRVLQWENIRCIDVESETGYTSPQIIGLTSGGNIVSTAPSFLGEYDVNDWNDVQEIHLCLSHSTVSQLSDFNFNFIVGKTCDGNLRTSISRGKSNFWGIREKCSKVQALGDTVTILTSAGHLRSSWLFAKEHSLSSLDSVSNDSQNQKKFVDFDVLEDGTVSFPNCKNWTGIVSACQMCRNDFVQGGTTVSCGLCEDGRVCYSSQTSDFSFTFGLGVSNLPQMCDAERDFIPGWENIVSIVPGQYFNPRYLASIDSSGKVRLHYFENTGVQLCVDDWCLFDDLRFITEKLEVARKHAITRRRAEAELKAKIADEKRRQAEEESIRLNEELRRTEEAHRRKIEELAQQKRTAEDKLAKLGFFAFAQKKALKEKVEEYAMELKELNKH